MEGLRGARLLVVFSAGGPVCVVCRPRGRPGHGANRGPPRGGVATSAQRGVPPYCLIRVSLPRRGAALCLSVGTSSACGGAPLPASSPVCARVPPTVYESRRCLSPSPEPTPCFTLGLPRVPYSRSENPGPQVYFPARPAGSSGARATRWNCFSVRHPGHTSRQGRSVHAYRRRSSWEILDRRDAEPDSQRHALTLTS